jgi:hypothetical protein
MANRSVRNIRSQKYRLPDSVCHSSDLNRIRRRESHRRNHHGIECGRLNRNGPGRCELILFVDRSRPKASQKKGSNERFSIITTTTCSKPAASGGGKAGAVRTSKLFRELNPSGHDASKKFVDRAGGRENGPGGQRKEKSKEQCFEGKVPMVLAREKLRCYFAKWPTICWRFRLPVFEDGPFNLNHAHMTVR